MLISYEKPLRSRTKQGISLLLVSPALNRIQQVTMGNEFGIEFHGKPGKLSWKPFRARCRMAQRANGTRSACRKLFSWHSSALRSFPLVFPLGHAFIHFCRFFCSASGARCNRAQGPCSTRYGTSILLPRKFVFRSLAIPTHAPSLTYLCPSSCLATTSCLEAKYRHKAHKGFHEGEKNMDSSYSSLEVFCQIEIWRIHARTIN